MEESVSFVVSLALLEGSMHCIPSGVGGWGGLVEVVGVGKGIDQES